MKDKQNQIESTANMKSMDALMMAAGIKAMDRSTASIVFLEKNRTIDKFVEEEVKLVVEHWAMLMDSRKHYKWPEINFDTRVVKWEQKLQKHITNNDRVKGDIEQAKKNIHQWEVTNKRKMLMK